MEFVYVVESKDLFGRGRLPKGWIEAGSSLRTYVDSFITDGFFIERDYAETRERYKQIIPYTIIYHGSKVLTYTRKTGDDRLVGRQSIGVGGHINPGDKRLDSNIVFNAAVREVLEEVPMMPKLAVQDKELFLDSIWHVGFLYDSSDAVGRVHFGVVYMLDTERINTPIEKFEYETEEAKAVVKEVSNIQFNNLEMWSAYSLDALFSWKG